MSCCPCRTLLCFIPAVKDASAGLISISETGKKKTVIEEGGVMMRLKHNLFICLIAGADVPGVATAARRTGWNTDTGCR